MNSILFFPEEIVGAGRASFGGDRLVYLDEMHQLKVGATLPCVEFGGRRGKCIVVEKTTDKVVIDFSLELDSPARTPTHLIVAVPRPQTVKKILQSATLLGASSVHFVRTANIEKSYLDSHTLHPSQIKIELVRALEQAYDGVPPSVYVHELFRPFIEDVFPTIAKKSSQCLFADTTGGEQLPSINNRKNVVFAVGPEAGWNDFERKAFVDHGFVTVSLGERILRTEIAVSTLLAQLNLLRAQSK